MKTAALISSLLITGCAAQPQVMPSSPASYTKSPVVTHQIDREDACLVALIRTNSFNKLALPMLKKCNAGNQEKCTAFLLFYGAAKWRYTLVIRRYVAIHDTCTREISKTTARTKATGVESVACAEWNIIVPGSQRSKCARYVLAFHRGEVLTQL